MQCSEVASDESVTRSSLFTSQGTITVGDKLFMMPNRTQVEVLQLWLDQDEVAYLIGGENARVKLKERFAALTRIAS